MDEQHDTQQDTHQDSMDEVHAEAGPVASATEPVRTGHAQVDGVLRTLEALPELPVDQHVAVFEAAHTGLREALSGARPAGPTQG